MNLIELILVSIVLTIGLFQSAYYCILDIKSRLLGTVFLFAFINAIVLITGWVVIELLSSLISGFNILLGVSLLVIIGFRIVMSALRYRKSDPFVIENSGQLISLAAAASIDTFLGGMALTLLNADMKLSIIFVFVITILTVLSALILKDSKAKVNPLQSAIIFGIVVIVVGVRILLNSFGINLW